MNLDLEDLSNKPPTRSHMAAVVVQIGTVDGYIVSGTPVLIQDIDEGLSSRVASESLGDVPGPGIWIWEGTMITHRSFEGDYDVDYAGEFRRATGVEISKLECGVDLGLWVETRDDEPDNTP